jgi:hypothetical protein
VLLKEILTRNRNNIALIIGNGSNRYGSAASTNSWDDLLLTLAKKYKIMAEEKIPEGITLTEFYDLLELKKPSSGTTKTYFQQEFCESMDDWKVFSHHENIVQWARTNGVPILTTNFDSIFSRAGKCQLLPERTTSFTDYYPWERYFGDVSLESPDSGFGIWHINGMKKYRRSIRLGLTHYMGSVERVRGWIHKGNERRLFSGKNVDSWAGVNTWLHIIFNKPLVIFGLGLDENEVFLRWLLIERARYFQKFPDRRQLAWFIYTSENEKLGKLYFLQGLGIQTIKVTNYDKIYGNNIWV